MDKKRVRERLRMDHVAKVEAAAAQRWTKNILVEVLGNHGQRISPELREQFKIAISALNEAEAFL